MGSNSFAFSRLVVGFALAFAAVSTAACAGSDEPTDDGAVPAPEDDLIKGTRHCGGFAGLSCPSGYACVDDPTDTCDPTKGGADCIGVCKKAAPAAHACGGIAGLACPAGQACVDDPSDTCDPKKGGADCPGLCQAAPAPRMCGGFAGLTCPAGQSCVDDPSDTCDPKKGGADCPGLCK